MFHTPAPIGIRRLLGTTVTTPRPPLYPVNDVFVHCLDGRNWRVSDGRYSKNDARCLIGLITQEGTEFHILPFTSHDACRLFPSLEEAVISLLGSEAQLASGRNRNSQAWILF